jgi:lipopolysaccharide assembly outer membrane protein LptD (OstA)
LPITPPAKHFLKIVLLISLFSGAYDNVFSQDFESSADTLVKKKKIITSDSLSSDTLNLIGDTIESSLIKNLPKKKKMLDSPVKYHAKDSMRFDVGLKKMFLFGDAKVQYETITLTAAYIELNMNTKIVYAIGMPDSSGNEIGRPVFEDKGQSFVSREMSFNFDTKKGLIKDVITKEGDGFIHGESVKKMENDEMYIKSGKYTTCESEVPHFHIHASKLKVIPDDKIITGPAYLAVENVPTPLVLPFGFFPNKKGRTSGILMPTYGDSPNLGFFLNGGGYYLALTDNIDLALRGDIYSKGSWGLNSSSNYHKRYKFKGAFDARYSNISIGEKELEGTPYFSRNKDFLIRWNHRQDPKARPNSLFTADVTAGTSNYNQLNAFSVGSQNFLTNTMQSNISYNKSWPGKPFNLTLNAGHSQNTISKEVNVILPQAVFNVNRFFPLKRKSSLGEQKWFEKIGVSYIANAKNEISTYDSLLFNSESMNRFRNGMMHNVNVATSYRMLKYFTVNPNMNYTDRWTLQTINKFMDANDSLVTDTINGFRRVGEWNFNTNFTTTMYGMYQFKKGKISAIRHVLTPGIGLTYRPDQGTQRFGYYSATQMPTSYSPFDIGVYGRPAPGQQGLVNFSLINNIEMKVRSEKDTITGFKKVKIFENINLNSSHNIFADSLKWSPITITGRTRLFNNVDLNFGGAIDPYALSGDTVFPVRINQSEFSQTGRIGRLTDARVAISFNLRSKQTGTQRSAKATDEELRAIYANPNAYIDFNIPWSLNVFLNLNYNKHGLTPNFTRAITFTGDFNLTPKWKIGFNSGYDFTVKDFSYTTINVYRDLHCWELNFNWVPMGFNKSYSLDVRVKSAVLQDLKLTRRRSWFDME